MADLRQFSRRRIVAAFLLDWIGSIGALVAASAIRPDLGALPDRWIAILHTLGIPFWDVNWAAETTLSQLAVSPLLPLLVAFIWPFIFYTFSVYDGERAKTLGQELLNVFVSVIVASLTLAGFLFFTYRRTSRMVFVLFVAMDLALLLGARIAWWIYRRSRIGSVRRAGQPVLIVGAGSVGVRVVEELRKYAGSNMTLVGFVDDDPAKRDLEIAGLFVLGQIDELPGLVSAHGISDAIVALPLNAHERLVEVCTRLQRLSVRVHVVPDLFALSFPSSSLDGFGGIPVISLGQRGITEWQRLRKRVFDMVATVAAMVVLWPLLVAIAIAIKLDSRGPVLYRQERVGENGKPFRFLKFRSMRLDADASIHRAHVSRLIEENLSPEERKHAGGPGLKLVDDPRVTRLGHFLRRTSLDELPQLLNVLRGDMSLVGPRPPIDYEVALYKDWHKRRFDAPPGITGLWQAYARNQVAFDEMVRMDLDYINRQSLLLDLKILFKTSWAVITGRGAA